MPLNLRKLVDFVLSASFNNSHVGFKKFVLLRAALVVGAEVHADQLLAQVLLLLIDTLKEEVGQVVELRHRKDEVLRLGGALLGLCLGKLLAKANDLAVAVCAKLVVVALEVSADLVVGPAGAH